MIDNGAPTPGHQDDDITGMSIDAAAHWLMQQLDFSLRLLNITHEGVVCVDDACNVTIFNLGAEKLRTFSL